MLESFSKGELGLFFEGQHGLEKEALRVDHCGQISKDSPPQALGSPLYHPNYTLDFALAQLEMVTSPHKSIEKAYQELFDLHSYLYHSLPSETLWPCSCPSQIKDVASVKLAHFGFTEEGYQKWLYRKGLCYRYGKKMQLLSGIHYSYSFSENFWETFYKKNKSKLSFREFKDENYLNLIRNFLRYGWICSYLFGASPVCDATLFDKKPEKLEFLDDQTLYNPYSTSIRMSHAGYFSKIQSQRAISYNSLSEYLEGMKRILNTPIEKFKDIQVFREGKQVQINSNLLQLEAEHYSRIRPKPIPELKLRPVEALEKGIHFFENRILDLNPLSAQGVELKTLKFMHLFFIYCLLKKSPPIDQQEQQFIFKNQDLTAMEGRKPGLKLFDYSIQKEVTLKSWAEQILEEVSDLSKAFDAHFNNDYYSKLVFEQKNKVLDPSITPSAVILKDIREKGQGFSDWALEVSKKDRESYLKSVPNLSFEKEMKNLAFLSHKQLTENEKACEDKLFGYRDMELSTQMLILEALKRNLDVKVLDRKENFITIANEEKCEWFKQATFTSKDSQMTYFLMSNKNLSKKMLKKENLSVCEGSCFDDPLEAIEFYEKFKDHKLVLKPNQANYGEGIRFIEPNEFEDYVQSVHQIAESKDQILVEHFFSGDEYRFLVIDNRVVAICLREPLSIVCDGIRSLKEIALSAFEKLGNIDEKDLKRVLAKQGYNVNSIPISGVRVYLKETSNVATGGSSYDITDQVPKVFCDLAIKAAKSVKAFICGVDMMIQDLSKKDIDGNYVVLELNYNPALYLHRNPTSGKKRYVEKDLLDAVGL